MVFARACLMVAAFAAIVVIAPAAFADPSIENGKVAFIKNGCWQCHGFEGQGSVATSGGRVIADTELPLNAFMAFVRTSAGEMPPYRKEMLSDSDLTDIYAYLESRPKPKPANDIPLLNSLSPK